MTPIPNLRAPGPRGESRSAPARSDPHRALLARKRSPRGLLALGPAALLVLGVQLRASPRQEAAAFEGLGTTVAAFGRGQKVTFDELKDLLIWRHAQAEEGRSALRELLELRTLEQLAAERRVQVSPKQLNARWTQLESEVRASGEADNLEEYLEVNRVERDVFRHYLELAIVHEQLARAALEIPADMPITGEQQSMWLEGVLQQREYTEEAPPYTSGIVARSGEITIRRDELAAQLVQKLSDELLREACYQLLLEKCVLARMPDLSSQAIEDAVDTEIARRRADAESNPDYKGLDYEALLGAQGLSLASVRRDPAIRVAALSHFWLERSHAEADLRDMYEAERETFDGLFGEGVEVNVLVLKAARFKNELNPRTFEEADDELKKLRTRMQGKEDFMRLVKVHSEDPLSRDNGGRLGVVTRGAPRVPESIRDAVFEVLDGAQGDVNGQIVGPVQVQGASALLCLGARRRAPVWVEMKAYVEAETRRRFLEEQLLPQEVTTWLQ